MTSTENTENGLSRTVASVSALALVVVSIGVLAIARFATSDRTDGQNKANRAEKVLASSRTRENDQISALSCTKHSVSFLWFAGSQKFTLIEMLLSHCVIYIRYILHVSTPLERECQTK